jgi:type I restriction enzyme S subunit
LVVAGQSPSSDDVEDFGGEGVPFLQGNAEFGTRSPTPKHRCDVASKRAQRGDVLVSVRAPVGALNWADRDYGIGRGLAAVRPAETLDARFCWWWLHVAVHTLRAEATGSTYEAVAAEDIGWLRVPDWTLSEQSAIADFLDAETARIDALIAKKRRLIVEVDERWRRGLLGALGLAEHPSARPAPWIRDATPPGWEVKPLKRLLSRSWGGDWGGDPTDGGTNLPCVRAADFDFLRLQAVRGAARSFDHATVSSRCLEAGDLVIEKSGGGEGVPVGRVVAWRGDGAAVPTNFAGGLRAASDTDPDFVLLVFRAAYEVGLPWRSIKQTTGLQNLDVGHYLTHLWPVPERIVQAEIACGQLAALEAVRTLQARLEDQVALVQEHRQALISAAVTGELVVPGVAA